jgi:hypothetical protein
LLQLLFLFACAASDSPAIFLAFCRILPNGIVTSYTAKVITALILTALLPFILIIIHRLNKWIYTFPRWHRAPIHFPLSLLAALVVFAVLKITTGIKI